MASQVNALEIKLKDLEHKKGVFEKKNTEMKSQISRLETDLKNKIADDFVNMTGNDTLMYQESIIDEINAKDRLDQLAIGLDLSLDDNANKDKEKREDFEEQLAEMAMQMDSECAKLKAECDKQIAEVKKQMLLECEQKVQAARKAAAGEYSMENTEADEERIALLLHNGTLVL